MAERWEQDQAFWNDTMQREGAKSDTRLAWWRDAKFGLFIHWGLYSIPAGRWKGNFLKELENGFNIKQEFLLKNILH